MLNESIRPYERCLRARQPRKSRTWSCSKVLQVHLVRYSRCVPTCGFTPFIAHVSPYDLLQLSINFRAGLQAARQGSLPTADFLP
jgi:hypothetical protein